MSFRPSSGGGGFAGGINPWATNPQWSGSGTPQWQAPLPHHGSQTDLANWWRAQNDALLVQLIEAAQAVSPNIAAASSRIAQSRAERVAAGAALAPSVDAAASISRATAGRAAR